MRIKNDDVTQEYKKAFFSSEGNDKVTKVNKYYCMKKKKKRKKNSQSLVSGNAGKSQPTAPGNRRNNRVKIRELRLYDVKCNEPGQKSVGREINK